MKKFIYFLFFILISASNANATQKADEIKEKYNADCIKYCGEGYFYDRKGSKNNGEELVCTKYPYKCGYNCTYGWRFRYLVGGTNYTCQEAKQNPYRN